MAPAKGKELFHNPYTKKVRLFFDYPGEPWVKGRPPWQRKSQSEEWVIKRSESMRERIRTKGATNREVEGYKKLSETRKKGNYSPSPDVRRKISMSLTGRLQKWEENKSRASCRRGNCDVVYVLEMRTRDGLKFGKWGSTREKSFLYREKEFKRKGLSWEVFYWKNFGGDTEDTEALLGRVLSIYPAIGVPHFYGYTETFDWSDQALSELRRVLNGLD